MINTLPIILMLSLISIGCSNSENEARLLSNLENLQLERDSLLTAINEPKGDQGEKIFTFMTFQKEDAEQAMNFYVSLFDQSEIVDLKRWEKEMPGKEGTIMHATFSLNGRLYMCSDSPPVHEWDFSPAVSNFVECENESELESLFTSLSENGNVFMPLDNYGFSQKFGWVEDQFGISWQLNLK